MIIESHQVVEFLSGATVVGAVGHAVNTFPPPENKYGRWFLGLCQWCVGQRQQAQATKAGYTGQFPVPEQPKEPNP
jgi:hypothetical protein